MLLPLAISLWILRASIQTPFLCQARRIPEQFCKIHIKNVPNPPPWNKCVVI